MLEKYGEIPLPPYIQRKNIQEDKNTYQTVFAKTPGSVAAPTAGLHFTPEILENIREKRCKDCLYYSQCRAWNIFACERK